MKNDTIQRLGMQKEFFNWVKKMNDRILVGDRVEIVKVGSVIDIKQHTKGTVVKFLEDRGNPFIQIEFDNEIGTYTLYNEEGRFKKIK